MIRTVFGQELKNKLKTGIDKLADSVGSTLGPSGKNVIISDNDGIKITKDGVTVARSFEELEDPVENIGKEMIRKVSEKAVDNAGDGTTTATVLAAAIVNEGFKAITSGANNIEVKKGIDKAVKKVVKYLKNISQDISSEEHIRQVATISGNNDPVIGELIATALDKVGSDGVVYIEESKTGEDQLETVEGMMFDRGMKSPYFVTNNAMMQAVLDKPYVFLTDETITSAKQVIELLQVAASENKPLLIVANDIDGEALGVLILNKARGTIKVCAVKAPEYGDRKLAMLEDMATLTGATVVSQKKAMYLDKLKQSQIKELLGEARMVTVTNKDTTIIDGKGDEQKIKERLEDIKTQIDNSKSHFEKETLQNRLSKLAGGVAIVHVGGLSELEMKEKKDRVDDALHATKAALLEGVVPGGGVALLVSSYALDEVKTDNKDQALGVEIVQKAIRTPFMKIMQNAGIENFYEVIAKLNYSEDDIWNGYNVKTGKYENFLETGVLDPTKVTRTALEQAASVASTVLTTDSVVYHLPEEKKPNLDQLTDFMK